MMRFKRCVRSIGVAVIVLFAPAWAWAMNDSNSISFNQGTADVDAYASYAAGLDNQDDVTNANLGFGYYVINNLSLGLEGSGYSERVSGHGQWGYGVTAELRHHLLRFDKTTIFASAAFGPVESTGRIPQPRGTDFNYITRVGIGSTYRLRDNLDLLLGVRYFHLSNARLDGPERNPSINGIEGFAGLMWSWGGRK
jgi:hypothetical protein